MGDDIKNGLVNGVQDLSKGFVPIVLVIAMLGSAFYVGRKVEKVRIEQATTAAQVTEVSQKFDDTLMPLVRETADLKAEQSRQRDFNTQAERDMRLLQNDLNNIIIALGKSGIDVKQ
jgi:hypothetical protein